MMGVGCNGWEVGRVLREVGWEERRVRAREGVGSTKEIGGWQWNACIFMNIDKASMA